VEAGHSPPSPAPRFRHQREQQRFHSGNPGAPQGSQVAFLQGTGTISQTLIGLIAGAIYQITFLCRPAKQHLRPAGRPDMAVAGGRDDHRNVCARRVGAELCRITPQHFTASASSSHTIAFVGTDKNGGDNTVFIDNVRLALAPSLRVAFP
jgi:hypothetical protein